MPWEDVELNSGYRMPSIAFGTWNRGKGRKVINEVKQALDVGLRHIDSAQMYQNEYEVGIALSESALKREEVFITTKWSGTDNLDIPTSIQHSLSFMNLTYVDLYLIHGPLLAANGIPAAWKQMEELLANGFAKSIGISNFEIPDMESLLASAKVKPAVNQIELHPYVLAQYGSIADYAEEHGILVEAYSPLTPVTTYPGGPLDKPLRKISERLGATSDEVLLAWVRSKGAVPVTTSSKRARLEGYLNAGDFVLTQQDVLSLDTAGKLGPSQSRRHSATGGLVVLLLVVAWAYGIFTYVRRRQPSQAGYSRLPSWLSR